MPNSMVQDCGSQEQRSIAIEVKNQFSAQNKQFLSFKREKKEEEKLYSHQFSK